jgi:uncharacterized protein involved in response to NO
MPDGISSFFGAMDGRQRLLVFVLILVASTVLLSVVAIGNVTATIVGVVLLVSLFITRSVWAPDENQKTKIGLTSLALIGTSATAYFRLIEPNKEHVFDFVRSI